MTERASGPERYLRATQTSDLRVDLIAPCDADQLLAAAYASSGSKRKKLALRVYRMRATGDMTGARDLAQELGQLLRGRMVRVRQFDRRARFPSPLQARQMAMKILLWWHLPTCPVCAGRGHPTIPDTPNLDTSRECEPCHGSGIRPVERLVRTEYVEDVRWLVAEMEALAGVVFDDMARRLANRMDL